MAIDDQEASSSNPLKYSNSAQKTWKYHIFLSFRGEDTRNGFTGHLYHALKRSGLKVFRDDELERGEVISTELKQAIEDSHFAIVVLSKNYASSSWCLNELQHILHSRDNLCQQVFPIFYDVEPSDVRHQSGSFAEAFVMHQKLDNHIIEIWRDSLTKVAGLSGWDCNNRSEAELIDMVVEELLTKLMPPYSKGLIEIDRKVEQWKPVPGQLLNGREDEYDGSKRFCFCQLPAPRWTSWTVRNPGRRFYRCPKYNQEEDCSYFEWHDSEFSHRANTVIRQLLVDNEMLHEENSILRRAMMVVEDSLKR